MAHDMNTLKAELNLINSRVHELEKCAAVTSEKLTNIAVSVEKMSGALVRVLWVFGTAIIVATATFVVNGGLLIK